MPFVIGVLCSGFLLGVQVGVQVKCECYPIKYKYWPFTHNLITALSSAIT